MTEFDQEQQLARLGLNVSAVFNIENLPAAFIARLAQQCDDLHRYRQLILLGHLGPQLWQTLQQTPHIDWSENPIDRFSQKHLSSYLQQNPEVSRFTLLYPSDKPVNLQALGTLAGWHFPSPFMVGINVEWGSWFAYRAVALVEANFHETPKAVMHSPCTNCYEKTCINSCPANALDNGQFDLSACTNFRLQKNSPCRRSCLARKSCDIGRQWQYSDEQMEYHYQQSLETLLRWHTSADR